MNLNEKLPHSLVIQILPFSQIDGFKVKEKISI